MRIIDCGELKKLEHTAKSITAGDGAWSGNSGVAAEMKSTKANMTDKPAHHFNAAIAHMDAAKDAASGGDTDAVNYHVDTAKKHLEECKP